MPIIDTTKEVKILTKNCVDAYSTIVSDHGGTVSYLYDRDSKTKFKSVNGNRDNDTPVQIDITFNVNGVETQFTINQFMMLNTNVKDFVLYWYDSTSLTYKSVVDDSTSVDYSCHTFGSVYTSRVRLILKTTQKPNHEKEIGDLILARVRHVMSRGMASYQVAFRNKVSQIELGDGGLALAYSRPLGGRINRYGAQCVFNFLNRDDYEFLYELKDDGDPFLFYPESITRPKELWFVHWLNPFAANYMTQFVGNGYSIMMELMEI